MFTDDDLLMISGLQHIAFCERQWSLIHLECEWRENVLTVEGKQLHEHVHEQGSGSRDGVRTVRGLRLRSLEYGLYGVADLVEFRPDDSGVQVDGMRGRYVPYAVEYKRGRKRYDRANEIQLCAQSVCLEEMFGVEICHGAVYYGQPRRRSEVDISGDLRRELRELCERARSLLELKALARPNVGRHCKNCSMSEFCMPNVVTGDESPKYVAAVLKYATDSSVKGAEK